MAAAQRRELRFQHLTQAIDEVRRLAAGGYEQAGNWTLEQNLDHLNKTMRLAFEPASFRLPFPMRLAARLLKRPVLAKMRRGDRLMAAGAPGALQPTVDQSLPELVAEFERLAGQIESDESQLQDVHPLFGQFNRDQWRIMQRWHAGHHLSFLVPRES